MNHTEWTNSLLQADCWSTMWTQIFVIMLHMTDLAFSPQAVGPVAVTSLLLGSGLKDTISSDVQADPNNPTDPAAQMEYNMAAIQVCPQTL